MFAFKIKIFVYFSCFIFLTSAIAFSESKSLSVEWAMPNTQTITSYTLYYSYDRDMSTKIIAYNSNNPQATNATFTIDVTTSPVFLTVEAQKNNNENISSLPKLVCIPGMPSTISKVLGVSISN